MAGESNDWLEEAKRLYAVEEEALGSIAASLIAIAEELRLARLARNSNPSADA